MSFAAAFQPIDAHSPRERRTFVLAGLTAAAAVLLDQATKLWVTHAFSLHESRPLIDGFFSFTYVVNYGAAWSMFSGHGVLLLLIGCLVGAAAIFFFRSLAEGFPERYYAIMLVLAGTVGNSIDRLWRGGVVDFLDFHWRNVWRYPVFNVADIMICVGIGLFILSNLLRAKRRKTS